VAVAATEIRNVEQTLLSQLEKIKENLKQPNNNLALNSMRYYGLLNGAIAEVDNLAKLEPPYYIAHYPNGMVVSCLPSDQEEYMEEYRKHCQKEKKPQTEYMSKSTRLLR
jgi:hypothetical protein